MRKIVQPLCLLLSSILLLVIYWPSLQHVFRADHLAFLYDLTRGETSEIFTKFYSFSRTRTLFKGDAQLFRPVLFLLLGSEYAAFGTRQDLWQWMGIFLHFLVCSSLFVYLRLFFTFWKTLLIVGFFASLAIIQDAVIWQHINGYVLYCFFVGMSGFFAVKIQQSLQARQEPLQKHFWGLWAFATLSCFTHESGMILIFLTSFWLAFIDKKRWRFLILFSGGIFALALNFLDYQYWKGQGTFSEDNILHESLIGYLFNNLEASFSAAGKMLLESLSFGFFPENWSYNVLYDKLQATEPSLYFDSFFLGLIFSIFLILFVLWRFIVALKRNNWVSKSIQFSWSYVAITAIFAFCLLTVLGRVLIPRSPWTNVLAALSYQYLLWTYFVLILPLFQNFPLRPSLKRWLGLALAGYLLFYAIPKNARYNRDTNRRVAKIEEPFRKFHILTEQLIERHSTENDFSFRYCQFYQDQELINWMIHAQPEKMLYPSRMDILFGKYLQFAPKYWVYFDGQSFSENTDVQFCSKMLLSR